MRFKDKANGLLKLLSTPLAVSLLDTHPNDLGGNLSIHLDEEKSAQSIADEWRSWWPWAGIHPDCWKRLISYNDFCRRNHEGSPPGFDDLPNDLRELILQANALSLPRYSSVSLFTSSGDTLEIDTPSKQVRAKGMSPKKQHEVHRTTAYILHLLDHIHKTTGMVVRHVVDFGAGQGYLSHALYMSGLHVLALDSSSHQTESSEQRLRQLSPGVSVGTLTFRTVWIGEMPSHQNHPGRAADRVEGTTGLGECIDERILDVNADSKVDSDGPDPAPVVFLSLHACGSLTPTVLRYALEFTDRISLWFTAASVVVGCCYNLLEANDFPLSNTVKEFSPNFRMTPAHMQMAAQVPSQWLCNTEGVSASSLSIKKVLYRSLISPEVQTAPNTEARRLGRLNDRAYEGFDNFLSIASQRLGFDERRYREIYERDGLKTDRTPAARRIMTLHALRCILGPPIESLLIVDRLLWLEERISVLRSSLKFDAQLVNLFDQHTGSGRNLAIVLCPVN